MTPCATEPTSLSAFAPLIVVAPGLAARHRPGQGETVLWLHDYALDASSWSHLWARLPDWGHLGIDLPGHGISLPPGHDEGLPQLAGRIAAVARSREIRHLAGLGLGSLIALQMALDEPDAYSSCVLGAPWIGGEMAAHPAVDMQQVLAFEARVDGLGPWLRDRLLTGDAGLYADASREPQLRELLWRIVGAHGFWEFLDGWLERIVEHPQPAVELTRVRARTLIVIGERCSESDARCAGIASSAIRASSVVRLAGTGGLCVLEDLAAATAAIEAHLRPPSPSSPTTGN